MSIVRTGLLVHISIIACIALTLFCAGTAQALSDKGFVHTYKSFKPHKPRIGNRSAETRKYRQNQRKFNKFFTPKAAKPRKS